MFIEQARRASAANLNGVLMKPYVNTDTQPPVLWGPEFDSTAAVGYG